MTEFVDASEILNQAEEERQMAHSHVRDGANFFHEHEGQMFTRPEARDRLADELTIDDDIAQSVIAELVGDTVDPVVQAQVNGERYIGVAEFTEGDGWYGYIDYHDTLGKRRRVVCAQCVHNSTVDTEVAHATAGDPSGSFADQPDASYDELAERVLEHYESAHDGVKPEKVKTGASLVSGTTIAGSTAWHAGNDGSTSGLIADQLDGNHASYFAPSSQLTNHSHYSDYWSKYPSSSSTWITRTSITVDKAVPLRGYIKTTSNDEGSNGYLEGTKLRFVLYNEDGSTTTKKIAKTSGNAPASASGTWSSELVSDRVDSIDVEWYYEATSGDAKPEYWYQFDLLESV